MDKEPAPNFEVVDYNKLLMSISDSHADKLRNILFEIFKTEQRALLKRGAYKENLKLYAALNNVCEAELDKIAKKYSRTLQN